MIDRRTDEWMNRRTDPLIEPSYKTNLEQESDNDDVVKRKWKERKKRTSLRGDKNLGVQRCVHVVPSHTNCDQTKCCIISSCMELEMKQSLKKTKFLILKSAPFSTRELAMDQWSDK